ACMLDKNPEKQRRFDQDNVVGEIGNNTLSTRGVPSKIGAITYLIMKCVGIGAVGLVIGWSVVLSVWQLVEGFVAHTALSTGLLSVPLAVSVAVPLVFAVLVAAFLIIKTAHSIYKSHQEEKNCRQKLIVKFRHKLSVLSTIKSWLM
ncbi:MAG: hypothetical protein M3R00_08135, partial [Pseudomonadota bacterium]|nr:hypothetical protein [Pseudomonadota bacterium]